MREPARWLVALLGLTGCQSALPPRSAVRTQEQARTVATDDGSIEGAVLDARVDVGGGLKLHIHCEGSGVPLVVFDSGLAVDSQYWYLGSEPIAPRVAEFTRVCVYDRAGLGRSDPAPSGHSHRAMATELHELLQKSGEPGPYVFAGHSMGGVISQFVLAQYPTSVAGMVLIDSNPEPPPFDQIPAAMVEEFAQHMARVEGLQLETFRAGFEERKNLELDLGDRPLVILVAGKAPMATEGAQALLAARHQAQSELARLSANSALVVAHLSGHDISHESPALVLGAVRAAVHSVRTGFELDAETIARID